MLNKLVAFSLVRQAAKPPLVVTVGIALRATPKLSGRARASVQPLRGSWGGWQILVRTREYLAVNGLLPSPTAGNVDAVMVSLTNDLAILTACVVAVLASVQRTSHRQHAGAIKHMRVNHGGRHILVT